MPDQVDFEAEAVRLGLPLMMKSKSACELIGCGPTKLRELIHARKIDGVKRGKDLLIKTASMLRFNASLPRAEFALAPKKSKDVGVAA